MRRGPARRRAQEQFLARLACAARAIRRSTGTCGSSTASRRRLDPTSLSLLERDREVAGVYPVRIAYPAQAAESRRRRPRRPRVAGPRDRRARRRGRDRRAPRHRRRSSHPYLRGRVLSGRRRDRPGERRRSRSRIRRCRAARAARDRARGDRRRARTGPAGCTGSRRARRSSRSASRGWQPDAEGGYTVYSRTDQILAGLEAAVDPNDDGDAHDAARIALIGMVEPYAVVRGRPAGARGRRRGRSRHAHDRRPPGTTGGAGPGYGSIAGPVRAGRRSPSPPPTGASPLRRSACSCAPGCACSTRPTSRSAAHRPETVTADVVLVDRRTAARGISALFSTTV